jgi:hypothetical protein
MTTFDTKSALLPSRRRSARFKTLFGHTTYTAAIIRVPVWFDFVDKLDRRLTSPAAIAAFRKGC